VKMPNLSGDVGSRTSACRPAAAGPTAQAATTAHASARPLQRVVLFIRVLTFYLMEAT
jgi:hypothetical protein